MGMNGLGPTYFFPSNYMPYAPFPYLPYSGYPTNLMNYPMQFPTNGTPWSSPTDLSSGNIPRYFGQMYTGINYPLAMNPSQNHVEIIDVSPEYQMKQLGMQGEFNQNHLDPSKSKYDVKVSTQTQNITSVPSQFSQPIKSDKVYNTTFRRTYVYDPSNPNINIEPINVHYINGVEVTTTTPAPTTESDHVEPIKQWIDNHLKNTSK
ncbi:uncharacterized protein LOC115881478 isoform X2 [Sitophilus oryzae]|nr:uncharacterized protein LOC115881478 isoform X2 [Sitophilus oryzae]